MFSVFLLSESLLFVPSRRATGISPPYSSFPLILLILLIILSPANSLPTPRHSGGTLMKQKYALGGSGSSYIYGLVDSTYKDGMTKKECQTFVKNGKQESICACVCVSVRLSGSHSLSLSFSSIPLFFFFFCSAIFSLLYPFLFSLSLFLSLSYFSLPLSSVSSHSHCSRHGQRWIFGWSNQTGHHRPDRRGERSHSRWEVEK